MGVREPENLVSPRAKAYWALKATIGWLVLVVGQAVAWFLVDEPSRWQLVALVLTVVVAIAEVAVMPQWRYRVHRWEVTPTAVYTQTGWFSQERRIAPISRVQTVDTDRGPLARLFRLSTVTVTTASSAGALEIEGLDREEADRLVRHLTVVTEQTEDDAT